MDMEKKVLLKILSVLHSVTAEIAETADRDETTGAQDVMTDEEMVVVAEADTAEEIAVPADKLYEAFFREGFFIC